MKEPLLIEKREGIITAILNRPEVLNAINSDLAERIRILLEEVARQKDVRVLVLRGAGDRAFSAGTDLKERRGLNPEELWAQSRKLHRVCDLLETLPQATICVISGYCLGGGFEIALSSDIRVAAENAEFGFPEMTLGAFPGAGGPVRLPRIVGAAWAKEILLTARRLKADEAERLGLVHYTFAKEILEDRVRAISQKILGVSPLGARAVKEIINRGMGMSIEAATTLANALRQPLEATQDYQEGLRAQLEKRQPRFRGE